MNFRAAPHASIVLMSRRTNAPYEDELSEDGTELTYEGHDVPRSKGVDPKSVDQPWTVGRESPSENAKFASASGDGISRFRVYEKLKPGIWSDKGLFDLVRYEYKDSGGRKVFKFHMRLSANQGDTRHLPMAADRPASRIIPGWVKQEVFKRDRGACVLCGATDNLHFDHDYPYSRGGASVTPDNVRILCARHNLRKGARIE
jgi:hypothetical protein